jgi:ATP-dependent Clp protease ATP-binding subunit ClpB
MFDFRLFRFLARAWFVAVLLAVASLSLFSLSARAAETPNATPTQTSTAGIPPVAPSQYNPLNADSIPTNAPPWIDMTKEVLQRVQDRGGQYILGRDQEVRALDEKLATSEASTVIIQGNSGSGRTGLIEEYIRQHPQDQILRLNGEYLRGKNELEATQAFKDILFKVEGMNKAAAGQRRVILFIDNLAALQQGNIMQPIQALWEQVAWKQNLYKIIEADAETVGTAVKTNKFSNLKNLVDILPILPPEYDSVLARLMNERSRWESNGLKLSTAAIEEAARIGVRHRPDMALKYSQDLLDGTQHMIESNVNSGVLLKDREEAVLRQQQLKRSSLADDLKAETDVAGKAKLQDLITNLDADILKKKGEIAALTIPGSGDRTLAGLELQRMNLNNELEQARANKNMWTDLKSGVGSLKDRVLGPNQALPRVRTEADIVAEIGRVQTQIDNLEIDMIKPGADGRPVSRVSSKDVDALASQWLKVPPSRLSSNFDEGLHKIQDIKKVVYGQDHVIDAIEERLIIDNTKLYEGRDITKDEAGNIMRGLVKDSNRPIGTFWFGGPTGVGKTETAKQLAETLNYQLLTYDMSEFQQDHTVSRLIGSPPGYVGSQEVGQLISDVTKHPESVVLFDEIEKAHPKIQDAFLQILDSGRLSPANPQAGQPADFRKTIVVFTSNLAQKVGTWDRGELIAFLKSKSWTDQKIASVTKYDMQRLRTEAYKTYATDPVLAAAEGRQPMRTEFAARLDKVLVFNSLTQEDAVKIAQKTVRQLVKRMSYFYDVSLRFSADAMTELLTYFNQEEGGRSMRHAFDDLFRAPVARQVFDSKVKRGEVLVAGIGDNHQIEFKTSTSAAVAAAEKATTLKTPELTNLKDKLVANRKTEGTPELRQARAATGVLVKKVFDPQFLVSDRAYKALPGRK